VEQTLFANDLVVRRQTMSTSSKAALIVISVFIMLSAAAVGGGYWLLAAKERLTEEIRAAEAEGSQFAKGKESSACVDEAGARTRNIAFADINKVGMLLTECLANADDSRTFCNSVPSLSDEKSVSWGKELNKKYGLTGMVESAVLPTWLPIICESRLVPNNRTRTERAEQN
jgi:hypothetical protein